ncbi:Ada metal-binding domain-containing protein [Paraburkholderia sediminicola]|uniref:metal-binding protein n=1 Tax=Paraburkholderia sediminicola TaxID=458836 RepID=UPI0038B8CDDE
MTQSETFTLIGRNGQSYQSLIPGTLGGHRRNKLYGLLNCRAALRAIACGGYLKHRVFFLDEATAIAAGYRPCAVCLPDKYATWKASQPVQVTGKTAERTRS